jgi:hypothetical protein
MKTVPLTNPKKGMIAFSEIAGLMVEITKVTDNGFKFRVFNGQWNGTMTPEGMIIHAPDANRLRPGLGKDTFRRVTALTKTEAEQWYLRTSDVLHLIRKDADLDDREVDFTRVYQTQVTINVMGQDVSAENFVETLRVMGPAKIMREMDQGEFLGQVTYGAAELVEAGQVAHRATALGSDATFFPEYEEHATSDPEDAAGRILRAQMSQGLTNEGLEAASRHFIEKMGLSHAYAAFLESGQAIAFEDVGDPDEDLEDDEDDMTPN